MRRENDFDIEGQAQLAQEFEDIMARMARGNRSSAGDIWSALANVIWYRRGGGEVAYTFGAASRCVLRFTGISVGEGKYSPAQVSGRIRMGMAAAGWYPAIL